MTPDEEFETVEAMKALGGSFVQALALTYEKADNINRAKIIRAWPDEWRRYRELAARRRAREVKP